MTGARNGAGPHPVCRHVLCRCLELNGKEIVEMSSPFQLWILFLFLLLTLVTKVGSSYDEQYKHYPHRNGRKGFVEGSFYWWVGGFDLQLDGHVINTQDCHPGMLSQSMLTIHSPHVGDTVMLDFTCSVWRHSSQTLQSPRPFLGSCSATALFGTFPTQDFNWLPWLWCLVVQ